jgi:UPF0716 family protein affecting phage T7 exclusion
MFLAPIPEFCSDTLGLILLIPESLKATRHLFGWNSESRGLARLTFSLS